MLQGFFRIVLYFLVAYVLYRIIRFFQAVKQIGKNAAAPKPRSGLMVKDEMCNTYLPEEEALKLKQGGKDFYFCSETCRHKFLESKK